MAQHSLSWYKKRTAAINRAVGTALSPTELYRMQQAAGARKTFETQALEEIRSGEYKRPTALTGLRFLRSSFDAFALQNIGAQTFLQAPGVYHYKPSDLAFPEGVEADYGRRRAAAVEEGCRPPKPPARVARRVYWLDSEGLWHSRPHNSLDPSAIETYDKKPQGLRAFTVADAYAMTATQAARARILREVAPIQGYWEA